MRSGVRWFAGVLLFLGASSVCVGLLNLRQSELSAARLRNEPRIPFKSTFVWADGDKHEVETYRGQYEPNETEREHVQRHLREFNALKEAVRNAGK